jgi:hypothetical protein
MQNSENTALLNQILAEVNLQQKNKFGIIWKKVRN